MWEFIVNLFEVVILFLLFNGKLEKKEFQFSYLFQAICLIAQASLLFLFNKLQVSSIIILLLFLGIHFLYGCFFFKNKTATILFFSVLYTIGTIFSDALTTIIPTSFFHIDLASILQTGALRIPFTLIYIAILLLYTVILLCFNNQTFSLPLKERLIFILLSIVCIAILQGILIRQLTEASTSLQKDSFLSSIFFLVLILFVAFVLYIYNLGVILKQNQLLSEENIINRMDMKQYEQIVASTTELRSIKHDMQLHLSIIAAMLQEQNYENASSYINTYLTSFEQINPTVTSGKNAAIDYLLTNKLSYAKKHHIQTTHLICLPETTPLSDVLLCSLIGNLFDNAIEACLKIETTSLRYIQFQVKSYKDMLYLYMENSCNGAYCLDKNGLLLTDKPKAPIYHGIGLKRITQIINQANGFLNITPLPDKFKMLILIPLEEQ